LPKVTELNEITSASGADFLLYTTASGSSKKILVDNFATFVSGSTTIVATLDDLTNVSASSPNNLDVLTWNSSTGSWVAAEPTGSSVTSLDDLTNVSASSPNNNEVLTWNTSSGSWIPAPTSASSLKASDLTTRWEILTVGDVSNPDIVYADGDCIYVEVPI